MPMKMPSLKGELPAPQMSSSCPTWLPSRGVCGPAPHREAGCGPAWRSSPSPRPLQGASIPMCTYLEKGFY